VEHARTPQIDVAIPESQSLIDVHFVLRWKRRRLRRREDGKFVHHDLNAACSQVGVHPLWGPSDNTSGRRYHELTPQILRLGVYRRGTLGLEDELDDACPVAKVYEDQAAMIASTLYPAGHSDPAADGLLADVAAPFVSVSHG
jgi:hypothetical protein